MRMLQHIPRGPLADFVEVFWQFEGQTPAHDKEHVLPTGTLEIVINLRDEPLRVYDKQDTDRWSNYGTGVLCGTYSDYFVIDTAQQVLLMGIHFKPGGAFPFFHLPMGELRDLQVPVETLWKRGAGRMRERLLEAPTPAARFRVLEESLWEQARLPACRHPAVNLALHEFRKVPQQPKLSQFSERVGLSQRRMIELFTTQVGLTPKLFCRVQRFQEALRLVENERQPHWSQVALACGYFDQAHFIQEFREFTGFNPTAYLACRGENRNHIPLPR